jgi:RNA polymerase sigma factor (sigma-70 family)
VHGRSISSLAAHGISEGPDERQLRLGDGWWLGPATERSWKPAAALRRPEAVTGSVTPASRLARFDQLFIEHQRHVLAYAMRRTRALADAEDAAAETFAIAWRRLDAIPAAEPLPWLYGVARRVLANQRRGNGRRERLAALLRPEDDVATPIRVGEDLDGPASASLASLSPGDQEVLRLVAWEELGHREIAQVLGITPNAVAIRLHRARARFAHALARTTGEDDLKDPARSRTSTDVTGTKRAAWKGAAE